MKITPGKYRTRNGRVVHVVETGEGAPPSVSPIRGLVAGMPHTESWGAGGKYYPDGKSSGFDLVCRLPADTPSPDDEAYIMSLIRAALDEANARGFVVTVAQRPLLPLAMGHYETVPSLRQRIDHVAEAAIRGNYSL